MGLWLSRQHPQIPPARLAYDRPVIQPVCAGLPAIQHPIVAVKRAEEAHLETSDVRITEARITPFVWGVGCFTRIVLPRRVLEPLGTDWRKRQRQATGSEPKVRGAS